MCGIAGIFAFDSGAPPLDRELAVMASALKHRGPDGVGSFADGRVGLSHTRLSVIDLEGGWQPIANEDESVFVVFNGEIFNYLELRKDLQRRGHRFRTQSDTEVILHLYEDFGERFVEKLNGHFAIALWNRREQRLLLARDRTGIRPLFIARSEQRLAFASEAKALFQLPLVPRRLDPLALASVFSFWSVAGTRTLFEGIESLPPGHLMIVDAAGTRSRRYWDRCFPDAAVTRSEADCAEELHGLLVDAVRLQLRSDVPVGAYLSGGLDSSIITSIIKKQTLAPLRAFSLTFEDGEFDEAARQEELARHLGAERTSVACRRSDIGQAFPRTVWHAESAMVRTAPTPMMLLAGSVRAAGYRVVLTGEGADEVFAGYDLFKKAKIRRFMARRPASEWPARLLGRLYPLSPEWRAQALAWSARQAPHEMVPAGFEPWHPRCRDQSVEGHRLTSGDLLSSQGDRMAMAQSIEARFPFLDHRVIDFANQLPPAYKLRGLAEKHILRMAMKSELPESIARRPKRAYRAPDSSSFFRDGKPLDYVHELLSPARIRAAGIFDATAIGKLVTKCRSGPALGFGDNMAFIGALSTMLLHEQFIAPALAPQPLS
jgi:asparagine synthase (glutamine-hydrolysing)